MGNFKNKKGSTKDLATWKLGSRYMPFAIGYIMFSLLIIICISKGPTDQLVVSLFNLVYMVQAMIPQLCPREDAIQVNQYAL